MEETPPYARAVARAPTRALYSIFWVIRNPARFPRVSVSSEIPTSSNPFDLCLLYTSTNPGISALQGGHQVAEKLMTVGFPAGRGGEEKLRIGSCRGNG